MSTPGITGAPGKCPWKNVSFIVIFLHPITWLGDNSYTLSTNKNGGRCGNISIIALTSITGV